MKIVGYAREAEVKLVIKCWVCNGTGEQRGEKCYECEGKATEEITISLGELFKALGLEAASGSHGSISKDGIHEW